MAGDAIVLKIRISWWFVPYVRTLLFFCSITGSEPDPVKLAKMVARATKVSLR